MRLLFFLLTATLALGQDLNIKPGASIKFQDADGSNWVGLKGPSGVATNYTLTLPNADGTAGQALLTDGAGSFYWGTAGGGGGGGSASLTANYVGYGDGAGELTGESVFTYNASSNTLNVPNLTSTTWAGTTSTVTNFRVKDAGLDNNLTITLGVDHAIDHTMLWNMPDQDIQVDWPAANFTVAGAEIQNSWGDGIKQTFNPSASTAGINVGSLAGNPSVPANGDLWYNTSTAKLVARVGNTNIDLGSTSLTGTYIGYGSGADAVTGEAAFTYNDSSNTLFVDNVRLGSGILAKTANPDTLMFSGGTASENVVFNLATSNTISLSSTSGVTSWDFGSINVTVPTEVYSSAGWNSDLTVPTKDAVRDQFQVTVPDGKLLLTEEEGVGASKLEVYSRSSITADRRLGFDTPDSDIEVTFPSSLTVAGSNTANTFTATQTWTASNVTTPTAMGALAVDLTKSLNTKTISGNATFTFSGSLSDGKWTELRVLNSGASEYTVTLPANVYASDSASVIGSFTVPAAAGGIPGMTHVVIGTDGTRYRLYAGGSGSGFPLTEDADFAGFNADNIGNLNAAYLYGDGSGITGLGASNLIGPMPDLSYGQITTTKAMVHTPTAGVSNVIVTTDTETTITLDATTETLTYSGTPATGTRFSYYLTAHSSDCTVTIPSTYSFATGGNRTTYVVRANKNAYITVIRTASSYLMWGDPVEIGTLPEDTTPAITAKVEIDQGSGGEFATLASIRDALGTTFNGSAAAPNADATEAVAFNALTFYHYCGATQELDLPAAAGYVGRGIVIRFDGSYVVTCDPNGSEVIDLNGTAMSAGEALIVTGTAGQVAVLVSDGTSWATSGGNAAYTQETP